MTSKKGKNSKPRKPSKWLGWHFIACAKDNKPRLNYNDGRLVKEGISLSCKGPLVMCENGMHASAKPLDALNYCPLGDKTYVCRVELVGERLDNDAKSCARTRRVIRMVECSKTLHEFACLCAETALNNEDKAGRPVDVRSRNAIKVKRLWAEGKATDKELAAARDAAGDAAWAAAWAAAWDAAQAAARDAAGDAARAAAGDAARAAARVAGDAARAAARAAAGNAAQAAWDAAQAAWDAARAAEDTARATQNQQLDKMLRDLVNLKKNQ
jgi:hypothetical protein